MITYAQFKAKYPSGSVVCSPENTYCGQCVSYVRQYMAQVHGIKTGPLGHASDFDTNPTFLKYYEKHTTNPRVGDIIVWNDDPGSWTDVYGHIAIYDGGAYMMNQNYGGNLKVSRNPVFTQGFVGYYRLKGGSNALATLTNKTDLNWLYKTMVGRSRGTGEGEDVYLGKDYKWVANDLWNSAEAAKRRADKAAEEARLRKTVAALTTEINALRNRVADLEKNPPSVPSTGDGFTSEDRSKLKSIYDKLTSVFK